MIIYKSKNTYWKYLYASFLRNIIYDRKFWKLYLIFISILFILNSFSAFMSIISRPSATALPLPVFLSFVILSISTWFIQMILLGLIVSVLVGPTLQYLRSRLTKMDFTEFFFDSDNLGYKVKYKKGLWTASFERRLLKGLYIHKNYILVKLDTTFYFLFPDKKERNLLIKQLTDSPYKALMIEKTK